MALSEKMRDPTFTIEDWANLDPNERKRCFSFPYKNRHVAYLTADMPQGNTTDAKIENCKSRLGKWCGLAFWKDFKSIDSSLALSASILFGILP